MSVGLAFAQGTSTSFERNAYQKLLRTLRYSEIFRISVSKSCVEHPHVLQSEIVGPLCNKISSIPTETIEKAAEPYMRAHLSADEVDKALAFWSSSQGSLIQSKIVKELADRKLYLLTDEELTILDRANKSSFGLALSRLANDTSASIAIIKTVSRNAP